MANYRCSSTYLGPDTPHSTHTTQHYASQVYRCHCTLRRMASKSPTVDCTATNNRPESIRDTLTISQKLIVYLFLLRCRTSTRARESNVFPKTSERLITCRMNSTATTRKPEKYIQTTIGRHGFLSCLSLFVSSFFFFSVVLTTVVLSQSVSIDINGKVFLGSPRIASHPTDFKLCHKSFAWTKLPIGRIRCNLFGNTMLVLCSQSELVVGSVR